MGKRMLLLFSATLIIALLPVQAFAMSASDMGIGDTATPESYLLYQVASDEVNAEYGTNIRVLPFNDYEVRGMPVPKAPTPEGLEQFKARLGEHAEQVESRNLEAQLLFINDSFETSIEIHPETAIPEEFCTNATPWGVKKMVEIIQDKGYGDDVIRYVAGHNSAFATEIESSNLVLGIDQRNVVNSPDSNNNQLVRGGGTYTHSVFDSLGTSKLNGALSNNSGSWKWTSTNWASWTAKPLYPYFVAYSSTITTLSYPATSVNVYHSGAVYDYDYRFMIEYYAYTSFTTAHSASAAASQAGW